MNRTQKFIKNTMATGVYQAVMMLSGFILPKVMLRFYGSEINGLVTSIAQFVNYFTLVEAGLSGAAIYALYKPLAEKDHKHISGVVVATRNFYNISGMIFTGFVILLALLYPLVVTTSQLSYLDMFFLILIIGVNGSIDFFLLGKYRAILTADQKQFVISLASMGYVLVNTAIVSTLAYFGFNIIIVRLVAVVAIVVRSIVLTVYCRKHYAYLNFKERPIKSALSKRWDALILQILGVVQTGAPVVLATIFTSLKEVSVYSVFNMVINGLNSIFSIFTSGLGSSFGDLIVRKELKSLQKAYAEFEFLYYSFLTFIYSVTLVQIMSFVNLYTKDIGDINYNQPLLGLLFTLNGYLFNLKTPQGMLVISAGMYKETKTQTIIQAVLAIVFGAVLGARYGIMGIMIGMCISNLYRDIDLLIFVPRHITYIPVANTVKNISYSVVCVGIVATVCMKLIIASNSILEWVYSSILVSVISVVTIAIIALIFRRTLLIQCVDRFHHAIKNRMY